MTNKKDIIWFDNEMKGRENQISTFLELRKNVKPRFEALKIIMIYMIIGGGWILLSDKVLGIFIKDPDVFKEIQLYKGWFYVATTGTIFYFIISRKMMLFKGAIDKVFEAYEDLSAAHEELMAMDEEISQQYDELEKHRSALMISDQRYKLAVEGANDGIWDWDLENGTYFFSIKWKNIFGYHNDEISDTFEIWKQLLHPEDQKRALDLVEAYLASKGGIYENTYRLRCKDGQYRWILSRGKGVWNHEGKAIRIAGSHTDITEQMKLQESLRREKELSESIIREAPMIIFVSDKQGNIMQFNPFAENVTGYTKEEVLGKNGIELLIPEGYKRSMHGLLRRAIRGKQLRNNEMNILCKNGRHITILWNTNVLHDQEGNIQGVVAIGMDITERINMEKRLESMAYHDSLTYLPNRIMLKEEVDRQINQDIKKKKKMAFIYLDIDNFKHINDTMGHAVGDKLIIYIANILSNHIKTPNMVARLGGDEFTILLVNIEKTNDIILEINRIFKYLKRPWVLEKQEFFISVSMGVAVYPEHGMNLATLMQNADTAMFHVKENGKDGFCLYTSDMREKTWQYIQMSNQLRTAINNEEFLLYYQPQIDLNSNKIIGVEALIRWINPEKGFISPMEFIPFAEETGNIGKIGEWVFKTACKQKRKWEEQGYSDIKMSVNLSSKMLTQIGLVSSIQQTLEEYCMNCCDIEFEITETAVMVDFEKAIEVLQQLKELGIGIALDDFGTGYSSLTYLQKLPIDILKVDREFIKNIVNEDEESYIFKSIVELAHNLGLKVVAEGVETKEQLAFLRKNGCDIGQGYYFSRPVSAADMETLLEYGQVIK